MTSAQKIIKYFAIGLAIALIVGILSSVATLLYNVAQALGVIKSGVSETLHEIADIGEFDKLEMELEATELEIKIGEVFKAESNDEKLKVSCKDGKLTVKESSGLFGKNDVDRRLILYIPESAAFDSVSIEAGAGNILIESLRAKQFSLDIGAGNFEAQYLEITKAANINGGVGKIAVSDGKINDLDIDLGIGETVLNVDLTGESDIDTGMGELRLTLKRDKTEYTASIDKGIGSVTYDGVSVSGGSKLGEGANKLDIDGGVGSINVSFNK
ncbi:MAG: DUF4097 family beta strand repeat protein [Clostridia bacterium]|nr:DUF4097 family beta strand repeat protein [Clostridia bacterium]